MSTGVVLSLCDRTGNMVRPWADAGYECRCYDIAHDDHLIENFPGGGLIHYMPYDLLNPGIRRLLTRADRWRAIFAFPACTNGAVSGARWFQQKGMSGLIEYLELVEACREICESSKAAWMIENPISTLSTYWRKPDHTFHPWQFAGYQDGSADRYPKKTCLWTGNGFVMPEPNPLEPTDDRIHQMPPSDERANLRSVTPKGFARAVFEANHKVINQIELAGTDV